jgi:hypothetical protein
VRDNVFATTTFTDPGNVWRSDNIEVVVDADGSAGQYDSAAATAQQYILNPGAFPNPVLFTLGLTDPPEATGAVTLTPQEDGSFTYQYELALPGWNLIDDSGNGSRHDFAPGQIVGLALGFADFESAAAAAPEYHAFNSLDGKTGAFFDANGMPGFELLAPGDAPPTAPVLVTDYDANGTTDLDDFFLLAEKYGRLQGDPEFDPAFDHNGDGDTNGGDMFLFAENFGSSEPAPLPALRPGPNGGVQVHARIEESQLVITAHGLTAATGTIVHLEIDPAAVQFVGASAAWRKCDCYSVQIASGRPR